MADVTEQILQSTLKLIGRQRAEAGKTVDSMYHKFFYPAVPNESPVVK
ncbi:hypothetical protein M3N64_12795 [Sporolactobacillus sp. CPB3-1]|uniref:Uncharacterized protein n=1 Tax=Sporolactobacillus mangiferae TaxID=2940498 RepID=A0ABT0MD45_9BACL|nr:hypothetical protein [Sporolactobacillus mangiferae]MCL1632799.1 hypothetical protein [Sporolactobacillus mangiferae]